MSVPPYTIISVDLRHPNDERKRFEDSVAYRIMVKKTFVDLTCWK